VAVRDTSDTLTLLRRMTAAQNPPDLASTLSLHIGLADATPPGLRDDHHLSVGAARAGA
jgi:hypothetical protein